MKYLVKDAIQGTLLRIENTMDDAILEKDKWQAISSQHKAVIETIEEQEDPIMAIFQRSLDAAVTDRDDYGHQWSELVKEGKRPDAAHRMYIRYQQAQGFLEGLTNGIFIAGYNILSTVDSTKMIVTK